MRKVEKIPALVRRLYEVVRELEEIFPGRTFTPDGHLVGSLGEVRDLAASIHARLLALYRERPALNHERIR